MIAVRRLLRWFAALTLCALLAACGQDSEPARGPVVLAASSMQEALEDAAAAWSAGGSAEESAGERAEPVLSFAASSALARQVRQGAPADVFVSADEAWMDDLEAGGLLRPGTRADVAGNRLVVIRPQGAAPRTLADLGGDKLALADPAAVPAGRYARAALESLGLWSGVRDNVVAAENVRAALALVERGEAALGIVYATDALASDKVEVVERLPAGSHPPIRYPAAVIGDSAHPEAEAFAAFLTSAEAKAIFARRGFEPAE